MSAYARRMAGLALTIGWAPDPISLILSILGLVFAGFTLGLYLGERGRRQDAQRIARVDKPGRADVVIEPTPEETAAAALRPVEIETLAQRIAEQEGISLRKARDAAKGLLEEAENWSGGQPEQE